MFTNEFIEGKISRSRTRLAFFRRTGLFIKLSVFLFSILIMLGNGLDNGADISYIFFVIAILVPLVLPIPSRTFIPSKTWLEYSREYYSSVLSILQSEYPDICSISSIGECDVRMVNYSGLIHSSYEGFVGSNKICGEMNGRVFELCYAEIYNRGSCKFRGYFFQLYLHLGAEPVAEAIIRETEKLWLKKDMPDAGEMKASVKSNFLFIVFKSRKKLFGCKRMRQLNKIESDVACFEAYFGFLQEISSRAIEIQMDYYSRKINGE